MTDPNEALQLAVNRDPDRVSAASAAAYLRDASRLGRDNMFPEQVATCLNTYYRLVAAITYVAAQDVLALAYRALSGQLDAEEARTFDFSAWLLNRYRPAEPDKLPHEDPWRQQRTAPPLPRKGNQSKRATARRVARSKRERRGAMVQAAVRQDIAPAAVAVVRTTGARPAEIEAGVQLQRVDDEIYVTIYGAKVNEDRQTGQRWRTIAMSLDTPETQYLSQLVPHDGNTYRVTCSRYRLYRAIRLSAVEGLGRQLGSAVSPYVFRHMVTAAWRKTLAGRGELAGARGDRSTRSAEHYGGGSTGKGPTVWLVDCAVDLRIEGPRSRPAPTPGHTPV